MWNNRLNLNIREFGLKPQGEDAMTEIEILEKKMADLAERIAETRDRLPAHSVKPPVMMELLDLEDEYHRLMKQKTALKAGG